MSQTDVSTTAESSLEQQVDSASASELSSSESKNHDGSPGSPDDHFLAPPSEAIGKLLSATTNLSISGGLQNRWTLFRSILSLLGSFLTCGLGIWASLRLGLPFGYSALIGLSSGALVFAALVWLARPLEATSYVGTFGLTRYTSRGQANRVEVLRFSDAAQLRVQATRRYFNGIYLGDSSRYSWQDGSGKPLFEISASFKDQAHLTIPKDNPVHFARAAETAWSLFRLPQVLKTIENGEVANFDVGRNNSIGIGNDSIVLNFKGKVEQVPFEQLKQVTYKDGKMSVETLNPERNLFNSVGVFEFPLAQASDVRLMLLLLEDSTGIETMPRQDKQEEKR